MPRGVPNISRWRERPGLQPGRPLTERRARILGEQLAAWLEADTLAERVAAQAERLARATRRRRRPQQPVGAPAPRSAGGPPIPSSQ